MGGIFQLYGIGDWSGTHLGFCSELAMIDLANKLSSPWKPFTSLLPSRASCGRSRMLRPVRAVLP